MDHSASAKKRKRRNDDGSESDATTVSTASTSSARKRSRKKKQQQEQPQEQEQQQLRQIQEEGIQDPVSNLLQLQDKASLRKSETTVDRGVSYGRYSFRGIVSFPCIITRPLTTVLFYRRYERNHRKGIIVKESSLDTTSRGGCNCNPAHARVLAPLLIAATDGYAAGFYL